MSQFTGGTFGNSSKFIFFLLGAIFLVVGLGLIIGLGSLPFAGGAMVMTGGIFVVVAIILIVAGFFIGRSAARSDQILQTGIPGSATITGLTQTGVYLNENPQIQMNLLVQLPGEVPYAANHKEFVPLMLLGRLSSGAPLSVRVDQLDRSKIVIDWSGTGFAPPQAAPMMAAYAAQAPTPRDVHGGVADGREPGPGPGRAGGIIGRHAGRQSVLESGPGQLHRRAAARLPAPERPAGLGPR